MKNALVICFTDLGRDPRVDRQIRFLLEAGYSVTTFSEGPSKIEGVRFVSSRVETATTPVHKAKKLLYLMLGKYEQFYWDSPKMSTCLKRFQSELNGPFDLLISNDIDTLPFTLNVAGCSPVLFDAHEYAPKEFEHSFRWRVLYQSYKTYLCQTYMPQADRVMTVASGIAEEYASQFGIDEPAVVTNASPKAALRPSPVPEGQIRMIHHGGATPNRKIENMIEMMHHLDERFTLDLMLVPGIQGYLDKISALAEKTPRVRMVPAVPMHEIVTRANTYDVGLYLLEPHAFNDKHCLPNKFFEFIQGRLALAIGPSPEMKRLVEEYECGIVSDTFDPKDLANRLNALTREDIEAFKQKAHQASEELNAEVNASSFKTLVEELVC